MNSISNYYGKFISKLKVKSVVKLDDNAELKLSKESDTLNLNIKQVYKTSKENTSQIQILKGGLRLKEKSN